MPFHSIEPDLNLHYVVDDFAPPWTPHDTVLLLHGNAESAQAWFGWIPTLAARYRVIRPDMRGFGQSTPMPRDYGWSVERILDDFVDLMDRLDIQRFHVVGAKIGGTLALALAARQPQRVITVTGVGAVASGPFISPKVRTWVEHIETRGVESWAIATMPGRLGSAFPPAGAIWWAQLMGATPASTQLGFLTGVPRFELEDELPRIRCPALVLTTSGNQLNPLSETERWAARIPRSQVTVIPGDSYHAAASDSKICAEAVVRFIETHRDA